MIGLMTLSYWSDRNGGTILVIGNNLNDSTKNGVKLNLRIGQKSFKKFGGPVKLDF